jgi:selenocysteine lyase/cysteine desulfurase
MTEMSVAEAAAHFSSSGRYLNTASIGLPPRACVDAVQRCVAQWSRGELAAPDFDPFVAAARASFSRLLDVPAECVAIGATVSDFVGMVASSLPAGSEVVCAEEDFTSVLFPFLVRQQAGELAVRVVPLQRIAEAISPKTKMVALSAVQSADGRIFDAGAVRQAAGRHGAATLVDATQAAGWLPLTWSDFDFVVVAAYKWLLSPRGTAFLYVRPERLPQLRPHAAGWYAGADVWNAIYGPPLRLATTARRLDVSPAWLSWVGCAASLAFLEKVGVQSIREHNVRLASLFCERALGRTCESAIVSIAGDSAFERLREKKIAVSRRAGATRLSFHLHNTEDDAIAAADAVLLARV